MFSDLDLSFNLDNNQLAVQYDDDHDHRASSFQTDATPGLSRSVELADMFSGQEVHDSMGRHSLVTVTGNNSEGPSVTPREALLGPSTTSKQGSPTEELLDAYSSIINTNSGTINCGPTQNQLSLENRNDYGSAQASDPQHVTAESTNNIPDEDIIQTEMQSDLPSSYSASNTAAWVQKLSDINVQLFEHVATIPSLQDLQFKASAASEVFGTDAWNGKGFAIDKTFNLSQLLIEALNYLHSRLLHTSSSHSSPLPPPHSGATTPDHHSPGTAFLDQGSILLVLSSYLRLIDAYDRIFRNMQGSLTKTRAATTATKGPRHFRLPQLTIGAFSPPPSSVVQITLIVHLAETLLARIRGLVGSMENSAALHGGAEGGGESPGDITLRAIRAKEAKTMKMINSIQRMCSSRMLYPVERSLGW